MINQSTIIRLREMHLSGMADAYQDQLNDISYKELSFEERFSIIVEAEISRRKNNRLQKLIKAACLKFSNASIPDIEYHDDRKLDRSQILKLSTCSYIDEYHNIIITGASGNGKSWIACAFGIAACQHYYPVKYVRLPELLDEFSIARGTGNIKKVLKQYKSIRLLILDEWLLTPLSGQQSHDLLEIIEARHHCTSTIFCSQFKPGGWHKNIGQDTLVSCRL